MKRIAIPLALSALSCALAGCGGGAGGEAPLAVDPLKQVPSSANQSSGALAAYMRVLTAAPGDGREPVSVDAFSPPQPEDTEPEPVGG